MRRLSAILLLVVFSLPLASLFPAFGQGSEAGLPACCRRLGQHHCAMTMGERAQLQAADSDPAWRTPADECPYCPASVASGHADRWMPETPLISIAHQFGPALRVQQVETRWRIARERARHKRGPPMFSPA